MSTSTTPYPAPVHTSIRRLGAVGGMLLAELARVLQLAEVV